MIKCKYLFKKTGLVFGLLLESVSNLGLNNLDLHGSWPQMYESLGCEFVVFSLPSAAITIPTLATTSLSLSPKQKACL